MWPKMPQKDLWLQKPTMKSIGLNKNYKATVKYKKKCEYDDSISQSTVKSKCSDKNCQEKK